MERPFSERVAGPVWRREAEKWIGEQVAERGHTITGTIEQPRIRPWSTQLTVPTDTGRLWFKANCASMVFESRLQTELARLVPDAVDEPYAVRDDVGWMLTVDRGQTLGERQGPTIDDWRRVLRESGRVQRALADRRDTLLATGLPDCAPETVPARFDRLLEVFASLPDRHPAHVPHELATRLRAVRSELVDAVDALAASPLPATWQHGDLHPWNVFAVAGSALRLFDLGDSQWAHAAEILAVPYGWITSQTSLAWADVVDGYLESWDLEASDLTHLQRYVDLTQPINRAMTWWTCLAEASAAEWQEWGEAPLHHLTRVLDR